MARGKQLPQKPPQGPPSTPTNCFLVAGQDTFQQLQPKTRESKFSGVTSAHKKYKKKPNKKTSGNGVGTVECLACIFAVPGILSVLCRLEEFSWPTRRMCDILVNLPCAEVQVVSCGEYRSVRRFITSICSRVSCTASRC